jgi:hypothetical protein
MSGHFSSFLCYLWGVPARAFHWKGVEEGRVGLFEKVAEAECGLLGLKYFSERPFIWDVFFAMRLCEGALEDHMMSGVLGNGLGFHLSGVIVYGRWCGVCEVGCCAWAYEGIGGIWAETFRVVCIKAMCSSKSEDGGHDEAIMRFNCCTYGGWGFIPIRGFTGNVGWMVRGGVFRFDAVPHGLFRGDIVR